MFIDKNTDVAVEPCDQTLGYWLNRNAHIRGEQPAIIDGDRCISYAKLNEQSRQFASGLKSLGIGKGDVVAVQLPNIPEFIVAYLAICRMGAVMQTLHMPYRGADLKQLLAASNACAVVCLHAFKDYETAKELVQLKDSSGLRHVVVVGEVVSGAMSYQSFLQSAPLAVDYQPSRDDVFLLLYTSGTTSSPKGVPIRYRNFMESAYHSAVELDIVPGERILSVAPMTHLYGLFALHVTLAVGATCSLLASYTPDNFVAVLKAGNLAGVFAAPAHFSHCVASGMLDSALFDGTRFVCLSGSAVTSELAETVDNLMAEGSVIQLWGMSELQAGSFGRPTDPAEMRYTTAGRPSPDIQIRIVNDLGEVLPSGEEGEVQVKGPSVFAGYLNNEQENAKAFTEDGWFCSGDLGRLIEPDYLQLTGRLKEIINRGGVKYNPLDIEAIIDRMDNVQRSAIVPVNDSLMGEKACVFVVRATTELLTLEDIKSQLASVDVAKYKWPEMLEIIEEMPLTPTQKVIRGKLKPAEGH